MIVRIFHNSPSFKISEAKGILLRIDGSTYHIKLLTDIEYGTDSCTVSRKAGDTVVFNKYYCTLLRTRLK